MFVEISKTQFEKLKPRLQELGIRYEVSDCTLPEEERIMLHIEFLGELSSDQVRIINADLDAIYGLDSAGREHGRDLDEDGIPDRLEKDVEVVEVRRRPWEETGHGLIAEAKGFITGQAQEEEVTYETR